VSVRLKILVVVPSLGRGGAERTVSRLTREWVRDHEVEVAVFNGASPAYAPGGMVIDLRTSPAANRLIAPLFVGLARVVRLRRLIRSHRPDRIFGFMESANIPLLLAALLAGKTEKVTISIRGNPDRMRWFHRLLASVLYPRAARIVAVSEGAAVRLGQIIPASAARLRVIYSPLDLDEISALSGHTPDPLPTRDLGPYFFSAGRLDAGKAFDRMIRLFAEAQCPGMRLVIAGDGPERDRLTHLIAQSGLGDRIRMVGPTENPFAYMKRATAFLLTSQHEGFPVVLIEAFACGCPIVAFDCDFGPRESTPDGEAGFIVPVDDDARFIACLRGIAADPSLRERMGAAAFARSRQFGVGAVAAKWLEGIHP
jgi:glycosyltransferase involved in cell wall biosynthesis